MNEFLQSLSEWREIADQKTTYYSNFVLNDYALKDGKHEIPNYLEQELAPTK